jgi:hypothetical protein
MLARTKNRVNIKKLCSGHGISGLFELVVERRIITLDTARP